MASRTRSTFAMPWISAQLSTSSMIVAAIDSSCMRRRVLRRQPFRDLIETEAGLATDWNHRNLRLQRVHVARKLADRHAHDLGEIHFVDNHEVRAQKHVRMFFH